MGLNPKPNELKLIKAEKNLLHSKFSTVSREPWQTDMNISIGNPYWIALEHRKNLVI